MSYSLPNPALHTQSKSLIKSLPPEAAADNLYTREPGVSVTDVPFEVVSLHTKVE